MPADAIIFNSDGVQVAVVENGVARIRKITVARDLGTQVEGTAGVRTAAGASCPFALKPVLESGERTIGFGAPRGVFVAAEIATTRPSVASAWASIGRAGRTSGATSGSTGGTQPTTTSSSTRGAWASRRPPS